MWAYLGLVWSAGTLAPFFLVQVSGGVMPVSRNFFRVPQRCQTAWMAPSPGDPLGAEGGTFLGLTGSVGTLAPLFLVQVSSGTMRVS